MSGNIRRQIRLMDHVLRGQIETVNLQPKVADLPEMEMNQLRRVLRDNTDLSARIIRSMITLVTNIQRWENLVSGNPHERHRRHEYFRKFGNAAELLRPAQQALRKSKRLVDASFEKVQQKMNEREQPDNADNGETE